MTDSVNCLFLWSSHGLPFKGSDHKRWAKNSCNRDPDFQWVESDGNNRVLVKRTPYSSPVGLDYYSDVDHGWT